MITSSKPTSLGRFSKRGSISFNPRFPVSFFACAAALRTERELVYGEMVGEGDFEMVKDVEYATPEYFCACMSIVYLLRLNILA